MYKGFFLAFESAPKCGKTTLAQELTNRLQGCIHDNLLILQRGALSESDFGRTVSSLSFKDVGYSSAFYWADLVFDTLDRIKQVLFSEGIIIQDRYDLSVVTYREINGYCHDYLLLNEYLERGMIIHPDLTIFLNPKLDLIIERIEKDKQSSSIDTEFLNSPDKILEMQERIENYLIKLDRRYITLDTGQLDLNQCILIILDQIRKLWRPI